MLINKNLLNGPTTLDSMFVTQHVTLIHRIASVGRYYGSVNCDGVCRTLHFLVFDDAVPKNLKVDVTDLSAMHSDVPVVRPGATIFFHATKGHSGSHIKLSKENESVFDSSALGREDIALITPIRPGEYIISESTSKDELFLSVRNVADNDTRDSSKSVVEVQFETNHFSRKDVLISNLQGLAINGLPGSRIIGKRTTQLSSKAI